MSQDQNGMVEVGTERGTFVKHPSGRWEFKGREMQVEMYGETTLVVATDTGCIWIDVVNGTINVYEGDDLKGTKHGGILGKIGARHRALGVEVERDRRWAR